MIEISLVQIHPEPEIKANLILIKKALNQTKGKIIIFPELSLTGYHVDFSKLDQKAILDGLLEIQAYLSEDQKVLIGAPFYQDRQIYNSIYLVDRQKIEMVVQKHLLFPKLDDVFSCGYERKLIKINNIKIGMMICFELRAPEIARSLVKEGADVLIVFAQWPKERIFHWEVLLKARAIENQCYVIGVNSFGNSMAVSPKGEILCVLNDNEKIENIKIFFEDEQKIKIPYPLRTPFIRISEKLKTVEELKSLVEFRRKKRQKMVFTNGCFDILHAGHVDYLEKARTLGDFLVVGVNSDLSVKKIKGPERPINNEVFRVKTLSGLECVDYIILFDEETPEMLIKELKPDILVKGADWEEEKIVGASFVKSYGGKVVRIEFNYDISTTKIIEKIKQQLYYFT